MRRLGRWIERRPDAAAALALGLLPFLLFGRGLLPGRFMGASDILLLSYPWASLAPGRVPANGLLIDVAYVIHPFLLHAAQEISQGHFPLWNPHVFAGAPFFANPKTALLFPLTWLAFVLPAATAVTLASILKLTAGGLGAYWFLRLLPVGPLGAFVGALGFMLNGALIAWLQFPLGSTMVLLPVLLAVTERLRRSGDVRFAAALALLVAGSIFAGNPQGAVQNVLAASLWALYRAGTPGDRLGFLWRYGAGTALGLGMGAVQVLAFREYMHESAIYAAREQWMPVLSVPWRSAVSLLMPHYYGSPTGGDFWGPWNFNELAVSVGVVPLVVLPAALVGGWRRPGTRFFAALALLAAALVYGAPSIAGALAGVPGLSMLVALRLTPLLALSLSVLGAIGVEVVWGERPRSSRVMLWAVAAAAGAVAGLALASVVDDYPAALRARLRVSLFVQYLWLLLLVAAAVALVLRRLRGRLAAPGWGLGVAAVEVASLLPLALGYNPVLGSEIFYPTRPAIQHLQRESAAERSRVLLQVNVPMLWGLYDGAGYDGMTPRRIAELVRPNLAFDLLGNGSLHVRMVFGSPVADLLGVRHVAVPAGLGLAGPRWRLEYRGADAWVYRNEHTLPRVFLVPRARCVDDAAAVRLIRSGALDYRAEVLLADCAEAPASGPRGAVAAAELREYGANRVLVHAVTDSPAWLVLTDTWYPGWMVLVDGIPRRLWRADHAFRAVLLDPGRHDVEFRFRPSWLWPGLAVSGLAACLVAGLGLLPSLRRAALP